MNGIVCFDIDGQDSEEVVTCHYERCRKVINPDQPSITIQNPDGPGEVHFHHGGEDSCLARWRLDRVNQLHAAIALIHAQPFLPPTHLT